MRREGLEPSASPLSGVRSNHLSYRRMNGAEKGARTLDLDLGKVALYQLSYSRKMVAPEGLEPSTQAYLA